MMNDRRHQDRAQTSLGGAHCRLDDACAFVQSLVRELHDQNRALTREADQHDVSDLRVRVLRETRIEQARDWD